MRSSSTTAVPPLAGGVVMPVVPSTVRGSASASTSLSSTSIEIAVSMLVEPLSSAAIGGSLVSGSSTATVTVAMSHWPPASQTS